MRSIVSTGLVVLATALAGLQAKAADNGLAFVSYGGSFQDAQEKAFVKPFAEANHLNLVTDSGPTVAKIKAMVDTKNVQWDVVEVTEADYLNLVRLDLIEPIDYSQFDKATLDAIKSEFRPKFGVAAVLYSFGVGYRTDLGRKDHPSTFVEFWDTARFPGPRAIPAGTFPNPPWEEALLADGVAPKDLYPIDFARATRSLDKIKSQVSVWYDNTAPGVQALVSGDVDYALLPNGRVLQAKTQGAPVDFDYGQALLYTDLFVVPKGAPHKDAAMKMIAFASTAGPSAAFMKQINYSMPNTEALKALDPEYAKSLPTAPENLSRQVHVTGDFYGQDAGDGKTWQQYAADVWNKWFGK